MQMIGILWLKGLRGGSGDDVECTKRKKHIGLDYYLHAMQVRIVITIWQSMLPRHYVQHVGNITITLYYRWGEGGKSKGAGDKWHFKRTKCFHPKYFVGTYRNLFKT